MGIPSDSEAHRRDYSTDYVLGRDFLHDTLVGGISLIKLHDFFVQVQVFRFDNLQNLMRVRPIRRHVVLVSSSNTKMIKNSPVRPGQRRVLWSTR